MYINSEIEKIYPDFLLENRERLEGDVVALLWKNPMLLDDYKEVLSQEDAFLTFDGALLFKVIVDIRANGYKAIDATSLNLYLHDKQALKELLQSRQIIKSISAVAQLLNEDNAEKFVDDLTKYNTLNALHKQGFDISKHIHKFRDMTSSEVYDYLDFIISSTFIKRSKDTEVSDFTAGIDDYIDEANKGLQMGYSYKKSLPLLNYITSGVTEGFHLVAGLSGAGKTSFCIYTYILPFIEDGHNIILICNEQTKKEWWNMVLTTIMSSKFNYFGVTRKKFITGHFTDEQRMYIEKAVEWLKNQSGSIKFVKMFNYNLTETKMVLKKYAKLGFDVVLYDTFKAETGDGNSTNPLWQTLLHSSKELFQTASKEGMRLIATVQIAQRFASTRYLNNGCISGATQIVEVATTVLLLRNAWEDEIDSGSKFYVKPYNFIRREDGTYTDSKKEMDVSQIKKAMVVFVSKNRGGETEMEVLLNNQAYVNKFTEIGYCHVSRTAY